MRSDTRRNRRRLIDAAGELVRVTGASTTMQQIAAEAEIGVATAYRYFSSVEDLFAAYVLQIVEDLREYSTSQTLDGAELFTAVLEHWIELVLAHGPVMVELRSRSGLLTRYQGEDPLILALHEAWERPISALAAAHELPRGSAGPGLFLLNVLSDPREILDLSDTAKLNRSDIVKHIDAAFLGALSGWCAVRPRRAKPLLRRA